MDGVNVKLLGSRADDGAPVLLEVTDDCSSGVAILSQVKFPPSPNRGKIIRVDQSESYLMFFCKQKKWLKKVKNKIFEKNILGRPLFPGSVGKPET